MTGAEVTRQAIAKGWECSSFARQDLDINDGAAVSAATMHVMPDVVVNAAAYTAVDDAESNEDLATAVNGTGAGEVARAASAAGAAIIHISTDYVFDGRATEAYKASDPVNPIGAYGRSKLAGEIAVRSAASRHIIVRTSWVFSHEGRNFVRTMLRLGSTRDEISVVSDQFGSPTSAADFAAALIRTAEAMRRDHAVHGTYHFSNSGVTTWYDFARAIFDIRGGVSPVLTPITTAQYPTPAKRPRWSVLDCTSFENEFGISRRPWRASLADVMEHIR